MFRTKQFSRASHELLLAPHKTVERIRRQNEDRKVGDKKVLGLVT